MNKASVLVFVGACAAMVGWLAIHERSNSAAPAPAGSAQPAGQGGMEAFDGGLEEPSLDLDDLGDSDAGVTMPDGTKVPELGDGPKSVRFGVILVEYAGAQGAKSGARSKAEAEKLVKEIAAEARNDFGAAVKKGDPGSVDDAGRMFRGILEPHPEYVLFSLEKDQVSEPIDTPRGFWIIKRIE
ncbi:MAG TPA: peptidylprolyl isomerase [Polyangiaceae bacterium]|jgi:PPIC-type peptidyl-prolyl cis-trans isomerase-like protein|nr:peptidylprolyl isomerase [Polyangiaceae bacterium]